MSDELVLNLPVAPSVNRFAHARNGRPLGNSSADVQHWRKLADGFLMTQKRHKIEGCYFIDIEYSKQQRGKFDLSNRTKALEDYLESRWIIDNDRRCDDIHISWADDVEKDWCRVTIRPSNDG